MTSNSLSTSFECDECEEEKHTLWLHNASFVVDPVKSENCELLLLHDWNLLPFMHVSWPSLFAISQVFGTFVLRFVQILIILMNDKHNLKHTGQVVPHLYSFLHGGFVLVSLVTPLMQSIHLWIMQSSFWWDSIAERDSTAGENYKLWLNTKNVTFYTYLAVWHRIIVNTTCKSFLVNNHRHQEDWLNYRYYDLLRKNFRWLLALVFIFFW